MNPRNHPARVQKLGSVDDATDTRVTPQALWRQLHNQYHFTLDVAASAATAKTERYIDIEGDGLLTSWAGERCWCNPPYSDISAWVHKAWKEYRDRRTFIVMLLPANRTDSRWWATFVEPFRDTAGSGLRTRFLRHRIKFGFADGRVYKSSANFGSVLLVWGR